VTVELSVIAPCLNEEANLAALYERVFAAVEAAQIPAELVLVDDGSTDGTWDAIERMERESEGRVRGVRHDLNRGIAAAWRSGVREARGRYACFIDADLQNPPEQIVTLYRRLLESRADIAQGTRSSIERLRDSRLTFSRGLNLLLNLAFRTWATDSKSGFVLAPTPVLADVVAFRGSYRYFQTFITVAAKAKGYSVLEVETLFQSRYAGTSFVSTKTLRVSLGALADFPRAIAEFGLRRHPHGASIGPKTAPPVRRAHPYRGWRKLWFEAYFATMPLHAWKIGRRTRDLYLELKQSEWASRVELDELQLRKLQRLVQHAYVHVPHYRDAMRAAGIDPGSIERLEDIGRLPLLDKADVRRGLYFDLFADNHDKKRMQRISTSGSTGEPFVTYGDQYQLEFRFATTLRALEWTGWRFGDRQARLWHQTIGMSRLEVARERVDAWFMRRLFVPAYEMAPDQLEEFVRRIREHRPVLVDGYAESFNFLAHYATEGGNPGFSPKAIMSSAQMLTESSRDAIEKAFGARVFDKYGSREFSGIAYECASSRDHHVMDESYLVELLVEGRPAEPGETGEVVITDLNNFSVPLIRYRIGDLAVAVEQSEPCACGRWLSRIGRIEGRTQAIVHCADGTWLPGTFFAHFFKDYEYAIRFFQVHQTEVGSMTLRLVKNSRFTDDALTELLDGLRSFTGQTMAIDVEFVDEIPLGVTGKRTPVVSEVALDFQQVTRE
jgi:phenylacetate-coenzyme A ligase PaaK-like adenylate-forming protein/glycosyltransferase involved in cell wall biosynthesis